MEKSEPIMTENDVNYIRAIYVAVDMPKLGIVDECDFWEYERRIGKMISNIRKNLKFLLNKLRFAAKYSILLKKILVLLCLINVLNCLLVLAD